MRQQSIYARKDKHWLELKWDQGKIMYNPLPSYKHIPKWPQGWYENLCRWYEMGKKKKQLLCFIFRLISMCLPWSLDSCWAFTAPRLLLFTLTDSLNHKHTAWYGVLSSVKSPKETAWSFGISKHVPECGKFSAEWSCSVEQNEVTCRWKKKLHLQFTLPECKDRCACKVVA